MHHKLVELRPEALLQVARIYAGAFSEPRWGEEWTVEKALAEIAEYGTREGEIFYRLDGDSNIQGFVIAVEHHHHMAPLQLISPRRGLFIEEVAVCPEHRGKGIAPELMREALAWGRELGLQFSSLRTRWDNTEMHHAIAKCGFCETHREEATTGGRTSLRIYYQIELMR